MANKYILSTSILSADFARLGEEIAAVEAAGADWIHVDVMDGHFVPNITMGPFIVATCRRITKLPLDVHLMIEKPERYIEAFAKAGASGLTVHVETCPDIDRDLEADQVAWMQSGRGVEPGNACRRDPACFNGSRLDPGDERAPRVTRGKASSRRRLQRYQRSAKSWTRCDPQHGWKWMAASIWKRFRK